MAEEKEFKFHVLILRSSIDDNNARKNMSLQA